MEGKKGKDKKGNRKKTQLFFSYMEGKFLFRKKCSCMLWEKDTIIFLMYEERMTAKQKMFVSNALKKTDGCFYHVWR